MKNRLVSIIFAIASILVMPASAAFAAPLGLATQAPTIQSSFAFIDFFEFFGDGDLSSFGAAVDSTDGVSPNGFAEIGFGIGFDLADPTTGATGGFDVFDDDGLFLGGNLKSVGFSENVIELEFDNLVGAGAAAFNSSVLMRIAFDDVLGPDPFSGLVDGNPYTGSLSISNVANTGTVPVPATLALLVPAFGALVWSRKRAHHGVVIRDIQVS